MKLGKSRGATYVEMLGLVGVVALAGIGTWSKFRGSVGSTASKEGDCVARMSADCKSNGGAETPIRAPVTMPVPSSPSSDTESACFIAGTPVLTPRGLVAIEQLRVGDEVVTMHDRTHEPGIRKLTDTYRHEDRGIVHLVLADDHGTTVEAFDVTPEHPFYVPGLGFTPVGDLVPGVTRVQRADASLLTVASAQLLMRTETVFNLEVDESHTYFVGTSNVWVHNQYPTPGGAGAAFASGGPTNVNGQGSPIEFFRPRFWRMLWNAQPMLPASGATVDQMGLNARHADGREWSRPTTNSPWALTRRANPPAPPPRVNYYDPRDIHRPRDTPTDIYLPRMSPSARP